MATYTHPDVLDAGLNIIKTNATKQVALLAAPANFADANTGANVLAATAMVGTDFTLGDGVAGVRQLTVAAKAGVAVLVSGNPTLVALLDVTNSKILRISDEVGGDALVSGGTVNFPSWVITST